MAIFHMRLQTGSRNNNKSARAKYDYIEREGRYKTRTKNPDVLYAVSGNMPSWADDAREYWTGADTYERTNGRLYNQLEFSLPVELSNDAKIKLASDVAKHITEGEHLPYTLAIHDNPGNPHCHLMISERANDGLYRPVSGWFGRHDSANPHASGARKARFMMEKTWIKGLRQEVEKLTNRALEVEGKEIRVDCRSYAEQGIGQIPTVHTGPSDGPAYARRQVRNKSIRAENARRKEAERAAEERQREAILPDWAEHFAPPDLGRARWQEAINENQRRIAALAKAAEAARKAEAEKRGSPMAATVTQPTASRRTDEAAPIKAEAPQKTARQALADEVVRLREAARQRAAKTATQPPASQLAEGHRPPIKPPEPELAVGSRVEVRPLRSTAKPLRGRVTAFNAQKIWIWPDGGAGALPFVRDKLEIARLPEPDRQAPHQAAPAQRKPDRDLGR